MKNKMLLTIMFVYADLSNKKVLGLGLLQSSY